MGGASSTHRRDEKYIYNLVRKHEGKRPLGGTHGRIILKWNA